MQTTSLDQPRPRAPYAVLVSLAVALGTALGLTGAPGATVSGSDHEGCPGPTYVVASGDTWFGIAGAAEVGVRALLAANGVDDARVLHPDDVLCLPEGAATGSSCSPANAPTYTVERGDHWYGIATRVGVGQRALFAANGVDAERLLHPGDVLCLPMGAEVPERTTGDGDPGADGNGRGGGDGGTYTVVAGDSWYDVARRSGVTLRSLLAANDAIDSRIIHPGEALTLPPGAAASSSSSSWSSSSSGGGSDRSDYTVAAGDSWYGIARRVEVSIRSLFAANDASEVRQLHPGDVLRLPEGASVSAASDRPAASAVSLAALPMQGPCWYADSWHAPRGGGRVHVGVDLFAATGSHVYAVVDGTLTNRVWDQPGLRAGNGWWLRAHDGSALFFYAHLDDFAPGLQVGSRVQAGEIIGFMGNTGNSAFPHLHFEIRPNGGSPINPYPIVKAAGGCRTGSGYEQPNGWIPGS